MICAIYIPEINGDLASSLLSTPEGKGGECGRVQRESTEDTDGEAHHRGFVQSYQPNSKASFFFSLVSVIRRCFGESYTAVPDRLIEKLAWRIPHDL